MRTVAAGRLKKGSRVLWFDSRASALAPHRVIDVIDFGDKVVLYLSNGQGDKRPWKGLKTERIYIPPKPSTKSTGRKSS